LSAAAGLEKASCILQASM